MRAATSVDLTGKVAVVTGALGKLGPLWTSALLDAGASVLGLDIAAQPSDDSAPSHGALPEGRLHLTRADVTDRASLEAALETCLDRFGTPSILVNNAGIDQPPDGGAEGWLFEAIPDTVSAAIMNVNALGTLRACQVFGPLIARHGGGSVINIGSLYGGSAPDPRLYAHLPLEPAFLKPPAYGISKAGVASLSRYLAALWGPDQVRVNTLSPGGVLGGQDECFREKFIAKVPMRRMAEGRDLTGPLLFLASDLSVYVTGIELMVDGGYSSW